MITNVEAANCGRQGSLFYILQWAGERKLWILARILAKSYRPTKNIMGASIF